LLRASLLCFVVKYEGNVANPLTQNLYTYVHNNPLKYNDPTGQWAHLIIGALIGTAIGGFGNAVTQLLKENKVLDCRCFVDLMFSVSLNCSKHH
jgi:hypothetical protein